MVVAFHYYNNSCVLWSAGELDDDDDEIEEDGVMYIEKLRQLGKKIDANGDGVVGLEDEESLGDTDEAEETALESYETPLDKISCPIDEYQIFKSLLESKYFFR